MRTVTIERNEVIQRHRGTTSSLLTLPIPPLPGTQVIKVIELYLFPIGVKPDIG